MDLLLARVAATTLPGVSEAHRYKEALMMVLGEQQVCVWLVHPVTDGDDPDTVLFSDVANLLPCCHSIGKGARVCCAALLASLLASPVMVLALQGLHERVRQELSAARKMEAGARNKAEECGAHAKASCS
jgi:hypothetical protein